MKKYTALCLIATIIAIVVFALFRMFDYTYKTCAFFSFLTVLFFTIIAVRLATLSKEPFQGAKYDNTMEVDDLQVKMADASKKRDYPSEITLWITTVNPDLGDSCVQGLVEYIQTEWNQEIFDIISTLPIEQQKLAVDSLILSTNYC